MILYRIHNVNAVNIYMLVFFQEMSSCRCVKWHFLYFCNIHTCLSCVPGFLGLLCVLILMPVIVEHWPVFRVLCTHQCIAPLSLMLKLVGNSFHMALQVFYFSKLLKFSYIDYCGRPPVSVFWK